MKNPSPLFVWKLISIVVVAAGIFMFFSDPMKAVFERRDDALSKRLSGIHFKEGETGIIFFGNSLMNQALPIRDDLLNAQLSEEFRKNGFSKPISAVEITSGGVNAWRLHALADKLIEARPSVIVIQSEMFVTRRRKKEPPPKLAKQVGTWSGVLNHQLFGQVQEKRNDQADKQFFAIEEKRPKAKRVKQEQVEETLAVAKELWGPQVVSTTDTEFQLAREFINRVSRLGIRVVVVELPVSQTAAKLCSEGYLKERTTALESLSKSRVMHLVYPRILSDDYFRDYSHLNRRGRREFIGWFFPVLSKEMVKSERNP